MGTKQDIRKRVLSQRSAMFPKVWAEKTEQIYQRVIVHPFFLEADEIYCYIDYKNEVGTRRLIEYAWKQHKKVAVPKILNKQMEFYYIQNFDELQEGYCQILEPITHRKADGEHVLVIMPGSVFDKNRNRIGYGGGFYDKYLSRHSQHYTMAIAFQLQVLESIPAEVYDIRPQIIITEEEIYV